MKTEKIYKTFAAFCKGENLIKGSVKNHLDGFTYCECKDRLTKKKVIIYFDNEDNCVYYY